MLSDSAASCHLSETLLSTTDNDLPLTLSEDRARYIADLLKWLYKVKIPDENITFRGEPIEPGNNKDNNWKDRVVWVSINAVR